ncbi:MAG: bifunctional riboflavin kinase/FAD synthetase [Lachnospiraceae bacterium]|nr:bifunctional riboflavin kinase/FAD synthetase [Lachnospiraceae bacterium]
MQIFSRVEDFNTMANADEGTAIAIGKFDGVHLGHKKLIDEITSQREKDLKPLIVTFESPVMDFFTGEHSKVLSTNDEKTALFEELGIEYIYMMPVNKENLSCDPEVFVRKVLCEGLHARHIAAGDDLSFGDKGAGNMALLNELSGELGFETVCIEDVLYNGEDISSTLIRQAVSEGDMESASAMLGGYYSISGVVAHGNRIGRTIDMPTINIIPDEEKLMPPNGVYLSEVTMGDKLMYGITNIGVKPTVSDTGKITAETYIYDFDDNVYGKKAIIALRHFMRPEIKFENLEMLKKQLHNDRVNGVSLLRTEVKI